MANVEREIMLQRAKNKKQNDDKTIDYRNFAIPWG
jgi:hypothetical protein